MGRLASIFVMVCLSLLAASCSGTAAPRQTAGPSHSEVGKEWEKGPVRVKLVLDKDTLTIAEELSLTLEADAEQDYEVDLPAFGDKLGEFGILDYRQEPPILSRTGRVVTRKTYRLEPFLSGDYTIAPMTVSFRKKSDGADRQDDSEAPQDTEHSITTEELHIKVRSLLGDDRKDLGLHPLFGPVALPSGPISVLYVCLGLAVLLLMGAGAFYLSRRRGRQTPETARVMPAHELAYGQLQDILDAKLLERGELKLFFARISDVARYYIENRFGLHAPKLTTEEFLSGISRNPPFGPDFRLLLDDLLHHCDLVKFAEHTPGPGEADTTVEACRAFIDATKEVVRV